MACNLTLTLTVQRHLNKNHPYSQNKFTVLHLSYQLKNILSRLPYIFLIFQDQNLGHDLLMAEYICGLFLGLLLCSIEHIPNFHDYERSIIMSQSKHICCILALPVISKLTHSSYKLLQLQQPKQLNISIQTDILHKNVKESEMHLMTYHMKTKHYFPSVRLYLVKFAIPFL